MALEYLAPLTDDLLRLAVRGLGLPPQPRVLDLCCGLGWASRLLASEFDAIVTGIDQSETLLRFARERALSAGLRDRVEFRQADARHIELPNNTFDLVLALGGALTYIGRAEGCERIRQLLKPGGALLLSDLIYLDSPVPEAVRRVLSAHAPDDEIRGLAMEPGVRAVFEEGIYRFENEQGYHDLLDTLGYDVVYTFPVPESAWNVYYEAAARGLEEPDPKLLIPVGPEELASFYCWGGRWSLSYLVCGARTRSDVSG